ncbi:arylsulfatase [Niabella insulamsoli]|uniref:sulfatase family protein n=1 Tax=Niabella insulamsoli TaxID=3144874 RepID=UPI0031FC17E2
MKIIRSVFIAFLSVLCLNIAAQTNAPNIIYILADDLGYGDVSAFNPQSKIKTAHIDALSETGMSFTDAHTNSAVCTPTRYGVLTGRYAWRTHLQSGVLWSYDSLLIAANQTTVASLLKNKGYATACIGKWHLGLGWQKDDGGLVDFSKTITSGPNTVGFDYFYGITASLDIPPYFYIENNKITAKKIDTIEGTSGKGFWRKGPIGDDFRHEEVLPHLIDKAAGYISAKAKNKQPFFLYLPLPSPHTPILPAEKYRGKTNTNEYGDFVLMTDDMVGKIVAAVANAGIAANTMIVFTSDNGVAPMANLKELEAAGHQSSFIFRGTKADIFEGGHRVPFIVKWPGKVKEGSKSDATICLTDFLATAADMVKQPLQAGEGVDSYSLLPLLTGKNKFQRTQTVHHSIDGNFAIREGKWKLAFAYGSGGWSAPVEKAAKKENLPSLQLFDLEKDISEQHNIASDHKEIVAALTKKLETIIHNGRSTPGAKQSNDVPVNYLKYK